MVTNGAAEHIKAAYHTLGLNPGQDVKTIKQAYRTLARALHPDRNPETQNTMATINQAYTTLLDYFKTTPPPASFSRLFSHWRQNLSRRLAVWLNPTKPAPSLPQPLLEAGEDNLPLSGDHSGGHSGDHWLLRDISRENKKLIYKVEVSGNPKSLALPLRRRRPCRVCQSSGKIWDKGANKPCGHCAGKGYLIKPVNISVPLPENWQPGQRFAIKTASPSVQLEIELHRPEEFEGARQ
ncbi:MAG: J domain-containing protein [Desulfarculales bacterium]|nr:J domain-containing protein [Desulfarculales bacterium]